MSNKIIKVFGIPRTGTNVLELMLAVNFKQCYVCNKNNAFFVHYLGWKHARPASLNTYKIMETKGNCELYFVFIIREFQEWKDHIIEKYIPTWEFPYPISEESSTFITQTPNGPEIYDSIKHYYDTMINSYLTLYNSISERSYIVNYADLKTKKTKILQEISTKFSLQQAEKHWVEINNYVDSLGNIQGLK